MSYALEKLGWHSFERLVQALLKRNVSLSVEAWGESGDFGRDAYYRGKLNYPNEKTVTDASFIFQVKHVSLLDKKAAVKAARKAYLGECKTLAKRFRRSSTRKKNLIYTFITNAPLSARARKSAKMEIENRLPNFDVVVWAKRDVEAMLDASPDIRKSYPELLSIRDLSHLINQSVDKEIFARSTLLVDEAKEMSNVFLATRAYARANNVLSTHGFLVLDGPPEMGKTAIARMLGLTSLLDGYEVYECREPADVLKFITESGKKLFIADDLFGRTEYDPTSGKQWEKDFPLILNRLGKASKLIWTSRKHILETAIKSIDVARLGRQRLKLNEVVVDASDLSLEEKALILYRHAKSSTNNMREKDFVRKHARLIVESPHFTPERIRRFTKDRLPVLSGLTDNEKIIRQYVKEEIENPTIGMARSFAVLAEPAKWLLIALLDFPYGTDCEELVDWVVGIDRSVTPVQLQRAIQDLNGTFLRVDDDLDAVEWVHPSYRDLVISILSEDADKQVRFLSHCSISGLKLALSETGGSQGKTTLPLANIARSWTVLNERVRETIADTHAWERRSLMEQLVASTESADVQSDPKQYARLKALAARAVREVNKQDADHLSLLAETVRLASNVGEGVSVAKLMAVLKESAIEIDSYAEMGFGELVDFIESWVDLYGAVHEYFRERAVPKPLQSVGRRFIRSLSSELKETLARDPVNVDEEDISSFENYWSELATVLSDYAVLYSNKLADSLASECEEIEKEFRWARQFEDDDDDEEARQIENDVMKFTPEDVDRLFEDL